MNLRDNFLTMLKAFDTADIEKTASYITVKHLHAEFCKKGFFYEDANRILGCMKIDVDDHFVNDDELFAAAMSGYSNAVKKMYDAFEKISPGLFWEMIQNKDNELALVYKRN